MGEASLEYQFRTAAEQEITHLSTESDDPLARQLCEKALAELAIKKQLLTGDSEPDPNLPVNRFGMFLTVYNTAGCDWYVNGGGFAMLAGDQYLNIHIPPAGPDSEPATLAKARADYIGIARFIRDNELPLKYVIGITYERLAMTAKRQHYAVMPIEVPPDLQAPMEALYREYLAPGREGKPFGRTVLVWHTRESFLAEFLGDES